MICKDYNSLTSTHALMCRILRLGPATSTKHGWIIAMAGLKKSYCCKLHTVCVVLRQCLHASTGCPILVCVHQLNPLTVNIHLPWGDQELQPTLRHASWSSCFFWVHPGIGLNYIYAGWCRRCPKMLCTKAMDLAVVLARN